MTRRFEARLLPDADYEGFLTALASNAAADGAELVFSAKDREKFGAAVVRRVNDALKSAARPFPSPLRRGIFPAA